MFQIIFTLGLFVSTEVAATKQAMHRWISNNNCGSTWITWINYIIGVEHITNWLINIVMYGKLISLDQSVLTGQQTCLLVI